MAVVQKSLRIPENILKEIDQIAKETQKDFSSIAKSLLEEAVKIYRCPGIIFTEGIRGRRARVAGTGIEVWEMIAAYQGVNRNKSRLHRAYHWLTDQQIQSAIGYYNLYTEEVDLLIAENEKWTEEHLYQRHPFLSSSRS